MEKFVEKLECEVYPITFTKFLLNKKRILSYFYKASTPDFKIRGPKYTIDYSDCKVCKTKEGDMLCRKHTSIDRVLNAENVAYDIDTEIYFYKNEIFKMIGEKLVIIYCPHPKLINGEITDKKVRKINPITIEDPNLTKLKEYKIIKMFNSSELLLQYMKCWFNNEFSLITIPVDYNGSDWCLIANN